MAISRIPDHLKNKSNILLKNFLVGVVGELFLYTKILLTLSLRRKAPHYFPLRLLSPWFFLPEHSLMLPAKHTQTHTQKDTSLSLNNKQNSTGGSYRPSAAFTMATVTMCANVCVISIISKREECPFLNAATGGYFRIS